MGFKRIASLSGSGQSGGFFAVGKAAILLARIGLRLGIEGERIIRSNPIDCASTFQLLLGFGIELSFFLEWE